MEINWKQPSKDELTRSFTTQERFMKRFLEDNIKATNKYDEKFLNSIGIFRKSDGSFDKKDLEKFTYNYERKYFNTTEQNSDNATLRSSYKWERKIK